MTTSTIKVRPLKLLAVVQAAGIKNARASVVTDALVALYRNRLVNVPALNELVAFANLATDVDLKKFEFKAGAIDYKNQLSNLAKAKTISALDEAVKGFRFKNNIKPAKVPRIRETKVKLVKEPKVKEPKVKEPKVKEPKVKEPKVKLVKEPKVKEPKVKEPKVKLVKEPKVKEPKVKEPKVKEPKVKEPKVKEPKVKETKPKVKFVGEFNDKISYEGTGKSIVIKVEPLDGGFPSSWKMVRDRTEETTHEKLIASLNKKLAKIEQARSAGQDMASVMKKLKAVLVEA